MRDPHLTTILTLTLLALILLASAGTNSWLLNYSYVKSIDIYAPAVSGSGRGVLTRITLTIAYPGEGRVFFSALPYTELDTQGAARVAAYVASVLANTSFERYDYYVVVESSVPVIGGPSAGALMTVGFLSLLTNTSLTPGVTMTGMINPDATVGPVGGLKEKLDAAASAGFKVFLIPLGQRYYQYPVVQEEKYPWGIVRRITYESVDLVKYGREINVTVAEVGSILDAYTYFTGSSITLKPATPAYSAASSIEAASISRVLGDLKGLVNETYSIARSIDLYRRALLLGGLESVKNTLVKLESLRNFSPAYVFTSALELYSSAVYYNLLSKLLAGSLSIRDIAGIVNTSLASIGGRLESLDNVVDPSSLVTASYVKALYYRAGYYYANALSSSDESSKLEYLAYALSFLKQAEIILNTTLFIRSEFNTGLKTTVSVVGLQALSSTVYSYINAIISEAGGDTSTLSEAADYYNLLNMQVTNDTAALLGFTINVIAGSVIAVHKVFDQGNLKSVVSSQAEVINALPGRTFKLPLVELLLESGIEAVNLGDYSSALNTYSKVVSIYLTATLVLNTSYTYIPQQSEVATPRSPVSTPQVQTGSSSSPATSIEGESTWRPGDGVKLYVTLAFIAATVISAIIALRLVRAGKNYFERLVARMPSSS